MRDGETRWREPPVAKTPRLAAMDHPASSSRLLSRRLRRILRNEKALSTILGLVRIHRTRSPCPDIRFAFRVILDSFRDGTVSSLRGGGGGLGIGGGSLLRCGGRGLGLMCREAHGLESVFRLRACGEVSGF